MDVLSAAVDALAMAGSMGWQILWPLVLGFTLSGVIQAVVRKERVTQLMADDSPRSIAVSALFGAASSSCSYAAVALARALFRKGADFAAAMAFEIASTNLVLELGLVLWFVMGWQFTAAEFVGGPIMIVLVALGFRLWMRGRIVEAARRQAEQRLAGSMEGHAAMDMSVQGDAGFWARLLSRDGVTAVSRYFVMDWAAVLRDIVLGPLIGPLLAVISFVCSVGNVPLAAVLWNGGISFGGVVSFLFADLIIIPIILIYKKYYGWKATSRICLVFYAAMVIAGYAVELIFGPLGMVPHDRSLAVAETGISWNYTTWLNIAFLALAAALLTVFLRTGSIGMLRMMGGSPEPAGRGDSASHRQE